MVYNSFRFVLFFFLICISWSQTKEISDAEKELKEINQNISRINEILGDLKEKQATEENSLKRLDFKILRNTKRYRSTKKALSITTKKISYNNEEKNKLSKEINSLKVVFEKRVVSSYKLPEQTWLDILLNSNSVEEFFRMVEYNKIIHKEEKEITKQLMSSISKRDNVIQTLNDEKAKSQKILKEQALVLKELKEDEKEKRIYIAANKKDQKKYKKSLFKFVEDRKSLERIMASLYAKRNNKSSSDSKSGLNNLSDYEPLHTKFSKNKGRFNWPVKGKILSYFGKKKAKGSKNVYIKNIGIDIGAKKSTNVQCIHKGRVALVEYLPSFGHTVVVDHGDGYFTSYANLNDVFVAQNEAIESGSVIGSVGNSGTIDGTAKLHFQLWAKNKPENPTKWLK